MTHEPGYTVKEAAALVGVHPQTVRKWIRNDACSVRRIGPCLRIRVPASEVVRLRGEAASVACDVPSAVGPGQKSPPR